MTRGNFGWEMKEQLKSIALTTTTVFPILQTGNGIVLCASEITASAGISALCESQGLKFATGCVHVCVNTDAVATVLIMCNYGTAASTPNFYSVITAGIDEGG